jgi:hypothetical protein
MKTTVRDTFKFTRGIVSGQQFPDYECTVDSASIGINPELAIKGFITIGLDRGTGRRNYYLSVECSCSSYTMSIDFHGIRSLDKAKRAFRFAANNASYVGVRVTELSDIIAMMQTQAQEK